MDKFDQERSIGEEYGYPTAQRDNGGYQPSAPSGNGNQRVPPPQPSLNSCSFSGQWNNPLFSQKHVVEAYILGVSPFGILGAHHFYLRRYAWGMLYFFTFGLFGLGYVTDWFKIPSFVREANEKAQMAFMGGCEPKKSLRDAYTLWLPPLGLFGAHHYYLQNYAWGFFYTITCGGFGIGWIVDCCRLPSMARETNKRIASKEVRPKSLLLAYALGLSPFGFLGAHHFYLRKPDWGVVYCQTLGLTGIGWLVDLIRMPFLVSRANKKLKGELLPKYYVDDAYLLWFGPYGFAGLHHFYLGRTGWGLFYFFTFGIFGIGWLIDMCRIPSLVKQANEIHKERLSILTSQFNASYPNANTPNTSNANTHGGFVHPSRSDSTQQVSSGSLDHSQAPPLQNHAQLQNPAQFEHPGQPGLHHSAANPYFYPAASGAMPSPYDAVSATPGTMPSLYGAVSATAPTCTSPYPPVSLQPPAYSEADGDAYGDRRPDQPPSYEASNEKEKE